MVRQADLKELPAIVEVTVNGKQRRLRTGFTTGACATAAAKVALIALKYQRTVESVAITLPLGQKVTFKINKCIISQREATCSVIKDAGDDPDVTHGAEIVVTASWKNEPGIALESGEGVGIVTKPGLGLEIGSPAITQVPRKMMLSVAKEVLGEERKGVRLVISVPGGIEMAKKTLNERLGVVGGISILGNTGIVMPYSTSSWMATIVQGIKVSLSNGCNTLVATTGDMSEEYARNILPLPDHAFLQMGEFVGFTLREATKKGAHKIILAGMIGKLSKIAAGHFQTHVAGSKVDIEFLASIAEKCGASRDFVNRGLKANTARHFGELVLADDIPDFFDALCQLVVEKCRSHGQDRLEVGCLLFNHDGKLLGQANVEEFNIPKERL